MGYYGYYGVAMGIVYHQKRKKTLGNIVDVWARNGSSWGSNLWDRI